MIIKLIDNMKLLTLVAFCVTAVVAKEMGLRSLHGFQVLSVAAVTHSEVELLKELQQDVELDFWTSPRYQGVTDIMVSPDQKNILTTLFATQGMKWSVKVHDVGKLVDEQRLENSKLKAVADSRFWSAYRTYAEIVSWLESISSNELVTLTVIGQSFEGRDIHQVKISSGNGENGELKQAIFLDAHLHAREWVTSAATTWIINQLVSFPENYKALLAKFDFFVIPLANPDGYEFSQTGGNRMWRKTRSINEGTSCRGCDPNRNFSYFFGGQSTSSNPCSDLYKGVEAFSEPETAAIRDAVFAVQAERVVIAYYTIHSYSQMWLLSWGHTQGAYPEDFPELLDWGQKSVGAIASVHGSVYQAGQSADILYGVGGSTDDWAKSEGVKYVTTLELRDTGRYGFLLPPDQIIPTAEEIWAGIQVIGDTVKNE